MRVTLHGEPASVTPVLGTNTNLFSDTLDKTSWEYARRASTGRAFHQERACEK